MTPAYCCLQILRHLLLVGDERLPSDTQDLNSVTAASSGERAPPLLVVRDEVGLGGKDQADTLEVPP